MGGDAAGDGRRTGVPRVGLHMLDVPERPAVVVRRQAEDPQHVNTLGLHTPGGVERHIILGGVVGMLNRAVVVGDICLDRQVLLLIR